MPCWSARKKKVVSPKSSLSVVNEVRKSGNNSVIKQFIATNPVEFAKGLQDIFSFLPINDLLSARLSCKRWNSSACYILRRKIEGAIILQRGLSYYTQVMSKSLDIPIGRLFLKIDDMDDPSAIKFFKIVGPSIIFLVLNLEGSSLAGFLTHIHHLQNLKQLSLNLFQEKFDNDHLALATTYKKRRATSIKIFIDDYDKPSTPCMHPLQHFESFVLSCEPEWKSNEGLLLEKLLEMSPQLRNVNLSKWPFMLKPNLFKKCDFQNLKFFSLKSLDDQGLSILGQMPLENLKTFECDLARDVRQESLQTFLETVATTLEYIEIKSTTNPVIYFKIPVAMKELNTIRLSTWVGPIWLDSIIGNVPQLKKLQLSHVNPSDIFAKDPVKQNLSVTWLAVNFGKGSHSMKKIFMCLKIFVSAFPNLKVLMMKKVSDKVMEIICDGWPLLEALRITTSFALSDSGITGLPASHLQKIQKIEHRLNCGCCVPFNVVEGRVDCNSARVTPHIALLKNLKDLRIEAEHGTNWTLTNLSLHLGLNELRQLNSLRLTCHELGPHWCLRCIAELSNLQSLTIMDRAISHDRYHEEELQYLLRRLPSLNLTFAETDSFVNKRGPSSSNTLQIN